ncbi:MAG: FxsA family protein [Gammaproteobacteria bacterium]|nr:FxsA family protein [Gammaproteobacteria bacterium]
MFKILLFLFITVPLLEIFLLLQVGSVIGAWNTVGLILLTAIVGTLLLRQQGLATLTRVHETLDRGRIPAGALVEGLILLFAGALLLTPGFFTDAIGFACLVPGLRRKLAGHLLAWFMEHRRSAENIEQPDIIEGEYWEEDDREHKDYLP